jgi:acyl carrier protein
MDFEPFLKELAEILEVDARELIRDYRVDRNPKWDSLTVISVMALVDDHFGAELSGSKLRDCTTMGQILDLIKDGKKA